MHNEAFNWQYVVVALIVVAAVISLWRNLSRQAKGTHSCGEGSCKCEPGKDKA